jgi:hypothetical protein
VVSTYGSSLVRDRAFCNVDLEKAVAISRAMAVAFAAFVPGVAHAEPVEEVIVTGGRRPDATPTEHHMNRDEVRLVPGAFGDPYRAIETLPGVIPTVSGLPYYYVRGAPPSAVGYFVDEVRVPYLFHFALGPSVLHPALIEEVSLHPAAFPASYGRYAGGIVAGRTREPATELYGEGSIRLFDLGAYLETPLLNGRASAGVGGRYSYSAALFSLFVPDTTIDYRDYNARASIRLNDEWRATAFTFGSFDYASQTRHPDNERSFEEVLFASEFHRLDLRLDRERPNGSTRIAATLGFDRTRIEGSRFAEDFVVGARARHRVRVSAEVDVEVGLDTFIDNYLADVPSPAALTARDYAKAEAFFGRRTETATGAWASANWHPRKGFDVTATARGDFFTSQGAHGIGPSPRVSARIPIVPRMSFLGALGVAAQPPAFSIPIPAVGYHGLPGGLGYGYQKSAGVEVLLPLRFTGRAVGFHHSYFNLRDFGRNVTNLTHALDLEEPQLVPNSPAQSFGAELQVSRKLTSRIGGFLSYTLSRTILGSTPTNVERISPFDRTHVFQVGSSVDLGANWRVSARFLTYRGWPDEGADPNAKVPKGRLSPFVRLDARVEKRWRFRKEGYISLVLEVLNATAAEEVIRRECNDLACFDTTVGPITVPSLGVEGAL